MIMTNHLAMLPNPTKRIDAWLRRCAPWLDENQAKPLIDKALARPMRWTADRLAQQLNLTSVERDRLKIKTIGAVDLNKEQRKQRRRERNREAQAAKRRAAGATPRAQSASQMKPWRDRGISRSGWYRDQKKAREVRLPDNSGQFRQQYRACISADEKVPASQHSEASFGLAGGSDRPIFSLTQPPHKPHLGRPLSEVPQAGELNGSTFSRTATPMDWPLSSAQSWAEIAQLKANIMQMEADRLRKIAEELANRRKHEQQPLKPQ